MIKDKATGLSPREKRFCEEYVKNNHHGADAVKKSGYAKKTSAAKVQASRLLKNVNVLKYIAQLDGEITRKCGLTSEYVLNGLRTVAERCMAREEALDEDGNPTGEFKFNPQGANKAFELLGKHLGLFEDKLKISGGTNVIIQPAKPTK